MRLIKLNIERQQWGIDKGKLFGEITFENQNAKVSCKLTEDQAYKMLEVMAESVVTSAHETAAILLSDLSRPVAQIEGEAA
jgi:hypothetical protein